MNDRNISVDDFYRSVENAAGPPLAHGFERALRFESKTPVTATAVYTGKNIAFIFSLDIRDQAIDLEVAKCREGELLMNPDSGGYLSSVFGHLVRRGFRGRPVSAVPLPPAASWAERRCFALVGLLSLPCSARLIADGEDALQ
jgi:hypothetical protein